MKGQCSLQLPFCFGVWFACDFGFLHHLSFILVFSHEMTHHLIVAGVTIPSVDIKVSVKLKKNLGEAIHNSDS